MLFERKQNSFEKKLTALCMLMLKLYFDKKLPDSDFYCLISAAHISVLEQDFFAAGRFKNLGQISM